MLFNIFCLAEFKVCYQQCMKTLLEVLSAKE
jgi:hypothetical protein